MLPDRCRELLTAYVDGELSSRQRRHVARLLRRSEEARGLLVQLQDDARSLRHLPSPPLSPDLAVPVLRSIAERGLTPGPRRPVAVSAGVPWLGPIAAWAAAASVLIILGAASYLYFMTSHPQADKRDVVRTEGNHSPSPSPDASPSPTRSKAEPPLTASHQGTEGNKDDAERSKPPEVVKQEDHKSKPSGREESSPAAKDESAFTDRLEMFQLERVADVLPMVVRIAGLERAPARTDWIAELRKDNAYRLELPCTNTIKAVQRVQNAVRANHVGLIVEKQARERIKQKWRTNYVLYLENLTPEELTRLVQQIGVEDRKSAAGKAVEIQFDRLVLTRWTPRDRKELTALLGVDVSAASSAVGPLGTDPREPLAERTARQIGQALSGQGSAPRPQNGKPAVKPPDNFALLMLYLPARPSSNSEDIKRFLDSRKPARPGTLRVLLVLRG